MAGEAIAYIRHNLHTFVPSYNQTQYSVVKTDMAIRETAFLSALLNPGGNEVGELLVGSQALKHSK